MIDNRENNVWTVYVHIVPQSITEYDYDKYYVGITSKSVIERWNNGNGYHNQIFYKAIKKYGWDNIEHYIIAQNLTENEAKNFEKILIKKLKSNTYKCKYGYNKTDGGDGTLGYVMSQEIKDKMSKNRIGQCNPFYGKTHTKEARLKMSKFRRGISLKGKKVYQFNLNGNFIKTYKSIKEAEQTYLIFNSQMGKHIRLHTPFLGYLWGFESDITIIDNIPKLNYEYKERVYSYSKIVYQFNINGDYIKQYSSIKEAEKSIGASLGTLGKAIKEQRKFLGYLWGCNDDITIVNNIPTLNYKYERKLHKNYKTVYMFNSNGSFIKKYNCPLEASKETNVNNKYITRAARIWNTSCGYYWRYENGIGFDKNNKPILLDKSKRG